MDSEDISADTSASSGEETSSVGMDSSDNSSDANIVSGYSVRLDDMVYDALATIDDEHDGTGRDIDGIFEFNKERYKIWESDRELLRDEVRNLVSEGHVEKVGNRYKIPSRVPATEASTEDSTTPQEPPNTSLVPTASEEKLIDATVKVVAEAEHFELQAKEASELADRHIQMLNLESNIILQLATEILNRCANGEKVFLR